MEVCRATYAVSNAGFRILSWTGLGMAVCLCASRAEAACGDYVHLGGRPDASRFATMSEGKYSASDSDFHRQSDSAPMREQVPCSGPQCRSDFPFPAPAPLPLVELAFPKWCCATSVATAPPLARSSHLPDESPGSAGVITSGIFRPPR